MKNGVSKEKEKVQGKENILSYKKETISNEVVSNKTRERKIDTA